jgi:hypothetical protein
VNLIGLDSSSVVNTAARHTRRCDQNHSAAGIRAGIMKMKFNFIEIEFFFKK